MSRARPEADCQELAFVASYPVGEPADVALEDYARALTRSRAAEVTRVPDDPIRVRGVHLCGPRAALERALRTDVEDFARDLALRGGGSGLGWS
jgi:hypothetical protein